LTPENNENDELILLFMPSLIALLVLAENEKGSALTEEGVLAIRDGGYCVMSYVDVPIKLDEE
jgi:hypothetical protein